MRCLYWLCDWIRTHAHHSIAVLLLIFAAAGAAFAACGTYKSTQSSGTPTGIDATATALFDATNRKYVAIGRATLPPGTDPLHPFANVTYAPTSTATPGPSPTPPAPSCGATIAGWPDILAKYGPLPEKGGCAAFTTAIGTQLVITTEGVNGGPGAIATYFCEPTDSSCMRGGAPKASNAAWTVYPAPFPGVAVQAIGDSSPDILILVGGRCFNLGTHRYDLNPGCH
jgi:hypothetical protein